MVREEPIMKARKATGRPAKTGANRGDIQPRRRTTLRVLTGARRLWRKGGAEKDPVRDRREALVLLLIALLFAANAVVYLLHHWNLTSQNEVRARPELPAAPRVIID